MFIPESYKDYGVSILFRSESTCSRMDFKWRGDELQKFMGRAEQRRALNTPNFFETEGLVKGVAQIIKIDLNLVAQYIVNEISNLTILE